MRRVTWVLALLLICISSSRAHAASFELIYPDTLDVSQDARGPDVLLFYDLGLIANHGATAIGSLDLGTISFVTEPSSYKFVLEPSITSYAASLYPAIAIGDVVGRVTASNIVEQDQIRPGETFRNTFPDKLLTMLLYRPRLGAELNTFEGWTAFRILMTMGAQAVRFVVHVNVHLADGTTTVRYLHAARVISVPLTDPVEATTWGRLRQLYR